MRIESTFGEATSDVGDSRRRLLISDLLRSLVPLLIVAGSLGMYVGFGHRPPPPSREGDGGHVEPVRTAVVEPFDGKLDLQVEGVVRPYRHVTIAAEVAGRVEHKAAACQEAGFVRKGTLLFEIDPADYELALERCTKALEQTDNALKEWQVEHDNTEALIVLAEQDVDLAHGEVERLQRLAGSRVSTPAEIDQARRAEITARNALLTLRSQLRLLDARYQRAVSARDLQRVHCARAQRDLERTKIHAPCDGTIVTENVEQDGYASSGATMVVMNDTRAGEVVCQIELDDMYWLWGTRAGERSAAQEEDLQAVPVPYQFPRWPVKVQFPFQDLVCEWEGEFMGYGGKGLDPLTRTVPCQVQVAHPRAGRLFRADGTAESQLPAPPLTVGMFVTVHAAVTPYLELLSVPTAALGEGNHVWTVEGGKLRSVRVQVARRLRDRVLVMRRDAALQPGASVVVSPLPFARDGLPVREVADP